MYILQDAVAINNKPTSVMIYLINLTDLSQNPHFESL